METKPYAAMDVVYRASQLAQVFRKNSMPVFLVRVTSSVDGKDGLHPITYAPPMQFPRTADWAEIVPEMGL